MSEKGRSHPHVYSGKRAFPSRSPVPFSQIQQQNQHCQMLLAQSNPSTQMMIILYGIPGCGKSTLAKRMIREFHPYNPYWVSFNQDLLGSRKAVESETRDALQSGYSTIIDRCNFDFDQRKTWIQMSWEQSFQSSVVAIQPADTARVLTICLILPEAENLRLCAQRAYERGDDGIHNPQAEWTSICGRMKAMLRYPSYDEGLDAIYHCTSTEDVDRFLQAIAYLGYQYYTPLGAECIPDWVGESTESRLEESVDQESSNCVAVENGYTHATVNDNTNDNTNNDNNGGDGSNERRFTSAVSILLHEEIVTTAVTTTESTVIQDD